MSDNIKVVVKVRPLISREIEEKLSYQWRVKNNSLYQLDQNGKDFGANFTFDKVYDKDTKTSHVYNDIAKPIVEAAIAGFNGTIFAYGQTSSGKTYTMSGTKTSPGIIPLAVLNLFEIIKKIPDRDFLVRVSYIEIYNETLKDLLNVEKKVKICETFQGVKLDATEKVTSTPEEVLEIMKEGEVNRQIGATNMNEESSRSHSIFQITIESREHIEGEEEVGSVNVSTLNLVDLAGSERAGQTGATGIRFKEGTHINKSLSVLALVIKQLSEGPHKHINYRDSKLTRILQNSLGGNAKTSIICAVTPAAVEETISTLQFANRAKSIKNKPEVNAVATNATMIQSLTKQLSKLQSQLESKKNLEQDNYNLTKQIEALQKLILNGFGQRTTTDFTGSYRRKTWCAPRRATISSLHPIEEDVVPTVPKFCTPVLKYNPMTIPGVSEFMPIQNAKLTTVSEEDSSRLVTPPPRDKHVNFNDEVIELDSDDDDTLDVQTCSPYHKCYGSSKTPPCILRKNAQQAEKNLQDLVELTEREKIYTPNTVELLEKLEQNTNLITSLEDEVNKLTRKCIEKDREMNQFIEKIAKTEEEVKALSLAKTNLEALCKDYNTKLTDWEVSYETIKRKAKVREEELLSLLNEQNTNITPKDSGVLLSRTIEKELSHFMNMSKDISLVNSESSINIPDNDEPNLQIQDLVTDLQTQLAHKNQMIIELESSIYTQKQRIESLETSSHELQQIVTNFNEKLSNVENEKALLMSTIDMLNSTIKGQKENLEIAHKDMESYNNLIQELQMKLSEKENVNIDDSVLEKMLANEEIFLANNENMKNIITCFKMALDCRNEEINNSKSTLLNNTVTTTDGKSLKELLEEKEIEINNLMEEMKPIKIQLNECISKINILTNEKNDVEVSNLQLSDKLNATQERYEKLEIDNKDVLKEVDNLKQNNEILSCVIAEKNLKEKEMLSNNEDLTNQIVKLTQNVTDLESVIKLKDDVIDTLRKTDEDTEKYISEAKTVVEKFQKILSILTGDTPKFPEINDILSVFTILSDSLNTLEATAVKITTQNNSYIENDIELNKKISVILEKHKGEIASLHLQIENLTKSLNEVKIQNEDLLKQRLELTEDLQKFQKALYTKDNEIEELKKKICNIEENDATLRKEIVNLHENLKTKDESSDQILQAKDSKIVNLELRIKEMETYLEEKSTEIITHTKELNDSLKNRDLLLDNIFKKISKLTQDYDIENCFSSQLEKNNVNIYEQIVLILDKVANHITLLKSKNDEDKPNLEKILSEAKKEIIDLTQQNLKLSDNVSKINEKNQTLITELEKMKVENKNLFGDLSKTSDILECLQNELQQKAKQIEDLEIKIKCWKEQVITLNRVMRQEKYELQSENTDLKLQYMELEKLTKMQHEVLVEPECFPNHIIRTIHTDNIVTYSPKSLLSLCCNRIIEVIQPSDNDDQSSSTSNLSLNFVNNDTQINICQCNQLSTELKAAQEENLRFKNTIEQLESENRCLLKEQEEVCKEVKLLLEPAIDLQKKITNHRTNLSTLTATTYAENKSLKSQLKVLQHHHKRYHNLCEKDIPAFKKQLQDLMIILKGDTSVLDMQNVSFKRYSLPGVLDKSSTISNLKNESTLDGDLLMLDTNVTLTTAADNTQMGCDQTCLDMTQGCLDYDATFQTSSLCQLDKNTVITQMKVLTSDNQKLFETVETLKVENSKLQEQVNEYTEIINNKLDSTRINTSFNDTLSPNNKSNIVHSDICEKCKNIEEFEAIQEKLNEEMKILTQELSDVKEQKATIEKKYNDLSLEIPSTETLVRKMSALEKEYNNLKDETIKLQTILSNKNKKIKQLQEENDTLSNQIMENISEVDDLRKELDTLKADNVKLSEKCSELTQEMQTSENAFNSNDVANCLRCLKKDELIQTLHTKYATEMHQKLNRSHSDSDSSSRYNKICTLQNELHASREDCKIITAEVDTIKNHLERSNLSISENMDLDESMGESNIFTFTKNFDGVDSQLNKFNMPNIAEERPVEIYNLDKMDCFNYYVEKTGADKENFDHSIKIIDVMKMLYNNLIEKHSNEIENLVNKLKDFEESKSQLQTQLNEVTTEYTKAVKVWEEKYDNIKTVMDTLSQIKQNIEIINAEISNEPDVDKDTKIVSLFKENLLKVLDTEFGLSSTEIFKSLINKIVSKHQKDLNKITNQYTELQEHMESVTAELNTVNENLIEMKSQMSDKEKEFNLLQTQKERVVEISNAVTLDIIRKEQELSETIKNGCQKLLENNIISSDDIDMTLPINKNIDLLFERLIIQSKSHNISELREEKKNLMFETENSKMIIQQKEKQLETLKVQNEKMQEINKGIILDLVEKENKLQSQKSLHEDLNKTLENLTQEINNLKEITLKKEIAIQTLESKLHEQKQNKAELTEVLQKIKFLEEENNNLKHLNKIITEEKDNFALELEKSGETIKLNTIELDKMMSDVLILRESVKENVSAMETLKLEAKSLLTQNVQLKGQLEKKHQDCSRLELDIKTHEKTAEIQNSMIIRLHKQKDEDSKILSEKEKQLEELTYKCVNLQKECEAMKDNIRNLKEEIDGLKNVKESLEARVSELASELEAGNKPRQSIDAIVENSRRRRQSIHDSRRTFDEEKHDEGDHNKMDTLFTSRSKPDDLFMDVDDASSFRSTPIRLSKGRDSLPSKLDQNDKDEQHPSRPSSVLATRKRRQSTHDSHRNTLPGTTEPESQTNKKDSYSKPLDATGNNGNVVSEVSQLREQLALCQQELEELKEKCKELDEECETCAEYLHERDELYMRLKKEKTALEQQISQLKETTDSNRSNLTGSKSFAHAAVNTDEDWANLHSVVVDRMSFDAEVEKNKKLTKAIEEFRLKNRDLKSMLAKMQKSMEKNAMKDNSATVRELQLTKSELETCKQELEQLREKCKELDEECETCAEYLRDSEEQCRRLKEAKAALETKLQELQDDVSNITHSVRRKRQSLHDQNRDSALELVDAATETSDDFLSYQVERDESSRQVVTDAQCQELRSLKLLAEKLSHQKTALEKELMRVSATQASHPVYVATGSAIVQNQHLTDIMKENQKLKKINAKLVNICKKRGKSTVDSNRENDDTSVQG